MNKNVKVEDLMDRVFISFDPDTSVREAVELLDRKRLFGACVTDKKGKVLGILSEKKCIELYLKALKDNSTDAVDSATVSDILYDDFKTISKSTGLAETARIFLETDFRRMPVVEAGLLVGQITRRDIMRVIDLFNR